MRQKSYRSNSTDSQLVEAANRFEEVQLAASEYEQHQGRSNELLHGALARLYGFGETLLVQATEPDRSLIQEFVEAKGLPWSKATRKNPYIALVKLAFKQSDSSHSQYATVLGYASKTQKEPSAFKAWLHDGGGIKGLYPKAADYLGSAKRQRNSQERASRLKIAREVLSARDHSPAVALPTGVSAPEGFAIVLAKVTGDGKAAIIDVIDDTEAGLDPILLRYAPSKAAAKAALAAEPLGQLYRAIDLVLGCTDDKTDGHVRDILLINSLAGGLPVCRVEAVSEAYTYAWAGMVLSGHLNCLPSNVPFILTSDDATFFRSEFANHKDWTMRAAERPQLDATQLGSPIELAPFEPAVRYRVSQPPSGHEKPFSATHSDQATVRQFLRDRRADHERKKSKSKETLRFPSVLKIQSRGGRLEIALPKLPNLVSTFGSSLPDRDLSHLALDIGDVERALGALAPWETTVDGSFVDLDVVDAALCFQAHFEDDVLTVVLPTKAGTDYNQSCVDLDLSGTGQITSTA